MQSEERAGPSGRPEDRLGAAELMACLDEITTVASLTEAAIIHFLCVFVWQIPGGCKLSNHTPRRPLSMTSFPACIMETRSIACLCFRVSVWRPGPHQFDWLILTFATVEPKKGHQENTVHLRWECYKVLQMHQWWSILTLGWTSCSLSRLIIVQKVKPWLNASAQRERREVDRPATQHVSLHVWGGKTSTTSQVSYLEKKDELREALDGLHHQAVERDAVHAGRLLPLLAEKRDITSWTAGNAPVPFLSACLFACLFLSAEKYYPGEKLAVCCSESKHVRIPGWEGVGVRVGEREVWKPRPVSHMHRWRRKFFTRLVSNVLL